MTAERSIALITGAADGIGRALALDWAAPGRTIVLADIDAERARATAAEIRERGAEAVVVIGDLRTPKGRQSLLDSMAPLPALDVVVLNAGISAFGPFARVPIAEQRAVYELNLLAPLALTNALLARQRIARTGSVVMISSLGHFTGYPGASIYAATKSGLATYARQLRLAYPWLSVLTVFPGPVRTAHARRYSPDNRREHRRMPPETLAAAIWAAVAERRSTLIPGRAARAAAWLGRLLPGLSERLMARLLPRS